MSPASTAQQIHRYDAAPSVCRCFVGNGSCTARTRCNGWPDATWARSGLVVQQDRGNVDAIRAGHAILAIVARDGRVGHHQLGRLLEKRQLVVAQRHEGRIGPDVILQVLHIGHAAQDGQHLRGRAGETEGPRGDAALRHPLLQAEHDVLRHV